MILILQQCKEITVCKLHQMDRRERVFYWKICLRAWKYRIRPQFAEAIPKHQRKYCKGVQKKVWQATSGRLFESIDLRRKNFVKFTPLSRYQFPRGFSLSVNEKHFSNTNKSIKLLNEIIVPYVKKERGKPHISYEGSC